MSIITLLTDFGTRDEYVGLMKGVILSINPRATLVDITHQITRQDIVQAAYAINAAYRYFPAGSVHLIVVDPGVGTGRSLLALEMENQYFVAPDNGVLTLLFNEKAVTSLIRLTNSKFFLDTVSRTFHGRDIIAPVGAHISAGIDFHELGDEITLENAVWLGDLQPRLLDSGEIAGKVVAIDHFGNLISNIDCQLLAQGNFSGQKNRIRIQIGSHTIDGICETYENGQANAPLALIGSRGYLEIAVDKGNAAQLLNVRKGDPVQVKI
jgi:S-adenosylmethionine hydrolase